MSDTAVRTSAPPIRDSIAIGLAALAGALLWLAFPPIGFGPYAYAGIGLLVYALRGTRPARAALLGFVAGLVQFLLLLQWMNVVGIDAWLALTIWCALWVAAFAVGARALMPLPLWPVWVAALWVLMETLRGSVPFGGFPWGRVAAAQADAPIAALAHWTGLSGVSLAAAFIGTATVGAVFVRRGWQPGSDRQVRAWLIAVIAVAWLPALLPVATVPVSGTATVAVVQGGTPSSGIGAYGDERQVVLDNHIKQTLILAEQVAAGKQPAPQAVIWPESSSDIDPFTDARAAAAIDATTKAVGVPILVGARIQSDDPDRVWNTGIVWDPVTGPGTPPDGMYMKMHLVPFGEVVPFRRTLEGFIDRLRYVPVDYKPGEIPGNLDLGGIPIANVICFEIAYDDVIDAVMSDPARAQILTVQTNNATYADGWQPEQQFEITRMRAIETGRSVVVAATTGVSAFIGPDGHATDTMDVGTAGSMSRPVGLVETASPAMLVGRAVTWLVSAVAVGALLAALVVTVAARRRGSGVDDR